MSGFEPQLAAARALSARFARTAAEDDRTGVLRHANFQALFDAGLLALTQPRDLGGLGFGLAAAQAVVTEIARGCPSTALVLGMHYNNHAAIGRGRGWPRHLIDRVARANLERVALINSAMVDARVGSPMHGFVTDTRARRDGGRWLISGHKKYATGSTSLEWATVSAVTDEEVPRLALFLVPLNSAGLRIEPVWNATGLRASASHDLILDEVAVPLDDIIDARPLAQAQNREPIGHFWFFTLIAAVYAGVARASADWANDFATGFRPGGLDKPIATLPRIQDILGEIGVRIVTSQLLLEGVARAADEGRTEGVEASAVRHVVIENALAVTLAVLDLGGNQSLWRDNPAERHHRDALCGRAHAPNNALLRAIVARPFLAEAEARAAAGTESQIAAPPPAAAAE